MIIDFTLSNFLSIRDKQTFSCFAEGAPNHLKSNIAHPGGSKIGVLRTVGIYGANASGKTNLLRGLEALRFLVLVSGNFKDGDSIPCYEPFLLSEQTKDSPITFELEFFTTESIRFLYSISFNSERILTESLDYYPGRVKANLFDRKEDHGWEDVTFGSLYKGGKKRFAFFENNSYLSKAGNSADSPELIRSIYSFFRKDIFHLGAQETVGMFDWKDDPQMVANIAKILCQVDTGICGIEIKEGEATNIDLPKSFPDALREKIISDAKKKVIFLHDGEDNKTEKFTEDMESSGTVKLMNMLPLLIDCFDSGGVLIFDELDNSFHPHLAELIIKLFNNPVINQHNSQLIFSTHNINLMSPDLLRRDQVWFTEKQDGATALICLDEFDKSTVKTGSPFSKWYGEGRFGAIPRINIKEISSIISKAAN